MPAPLDREVDEQGHRLASVDVEGIAVDPHLGTSQQGDGEHGGGEYPLRLSGITRAVTVSQRSCN